MFVRLFVLCGTALIVVGVDMKVTDGVTVEREALLSPTCVCLPGGVSNSFL